MNSTEVMDNYSIGQNEYFFWQNTTFGQMDTPNDSDKGAAYLNCGSPEKQCMPSITSNVPTPANRILIVDSRQRRVGV
jgi:hypothetical protein